MAKDKRLETYTEASLAVASFKAKHAKIFEQFDALLVAASEAEVALKEHVRENVKDNISNEFVKVTYSPSFKKYYDANVVIDQAKPKVRAALEASGAIIRQIDKEKFEKMVELGEVPVELKQEAFREDEQSPRISIKEIK